MEFKIGDRVRFLNDVGGGIISKIVNRSMVNVMIEEGFEIPVMSKELIKIDPVTAAERMFDKEIKVELPPDNGEIMEENEVRSSRLSNYLSPKKFEKGIYLAFAPHDQRWLLTGMIDFFFINNTSYDVLYSLLLKTKQNTFMSADYGNAEPSSKVLIQTIKREELEDWSRGLLQVLFHPNNTAKALMPLHTEFMVKMSRMLSEDSYIHSSFMSEKAVIIDLGVSLPVALEPQKDTPKQFIAKETPKSYFIDKHLIDAESAEVDLHIEKICEGAKPEDDGMILKIQFDYYTRCIESALEKKLHKVIFIHGVGSGVLKSLIRGDLKQYSNVAYNEAPYAKYGYGALEVLMRYTQFEL
ncbi:MAG: DUF2027 domain-containing protein [Bacteroidota bacterium]